MSFFDMYPMGGAMRGGVSVGGFPVGGAFDKYIVKGDKESGYNDAWKASMKKAKNTRDEKKQIVEIRVNEIINEGLMSGRKISKKEAKVIATGEYNLEKLQQDKRDLLAKRGPPKPRISRKGMPRFPMSSDALRLSEQRSRLTVKNAKARGTTLTPEHIDKIRHVLTEVGLGIYDLETGGAWYDDLWSGIKTGAKVAEHILPFVL